MSSQTEALYSKEKAIATECVKVHECIILKFLLMSALADARRPPLEEVLAEEDMDDVDPLLRGQQGYRLWYLTCRKCKGRAVCKEMDDGTRVEFQMKIPHNCVSDALSERAKRIEEAIVAEAADPGASLSLRRIHERHTQNQPAEIRKWIRTALQMKSKVSHRRKALLPPIPHNLRDLQILCWRCTYCT